LSAAAAAAEAAASRSDVICRRGAADVVSFRHKTNYRRADDDVRDERIDRVSALRCGRHASVEVSAADE